MSSLILLLAACDTNRHTCEGYIPLRGRAITFSLQDLGYIEDTGDYWPHGSGDEFEIITDQAGWETLTAHFDYGGPAPDFATQAAFVHHWSDGGCTDVPNYSGLRRSEALQVMMREGHDGGCSAYFPQSTLLIVDRDGATDLSWCDSR